jgi:hypothetical protein
MAQIDKATASSNGDLYHCTVWLVVERSEERSRMDCQQERERRRYRSAREAGDAVEAVGLEGLDQHYGRQDGGEPPGSPRRPRFQGTPLDYGSDCAIRAQEVCTLTAVDMQHSSIIEQAHQATGRARGASAGHAGTHGYPRGWGLSIPVGRIALTRPTRELRLCATPGIGDAPCDTLHRVIAPIASPMAHDRRMAGRQNRALEVCDGSRIETSRSRHRWGSRCGSPPPSNARQLPGL